MDKDLQWCIFWGMLLFLSEKGSMQRRLSIIALLISLLSNCTPRAYSYAEARRIGRQSEQRKQWHSNQRRATWKQQQRQKHLQQLDAAAHQRIK